MKKYLNNTTDVIFIMLGDKCNLQCKYCMQHAIRDKSVYADMSKDVIDFIRDIAENQESTLVLQFYGGEPLLYFNNIKEIVEKTEDIKNIKYSTISNGKLLDEDKVSFFNQYDFNVGISWDGPIVEQTRMYDVVKEKKDLLFKLDCLGFSAVISSLTSLDELFDAVDRLNDEYYKIHGYYFYLNTDEIMDNGLHNKDLLAINYERLSGEVRNLCDEYVRYLKREQTLSFVRSGFVEKYLNMLNGLAEFKYPFSKTACGNGYNVLNLDLQGNLYRCHNTHDKIGTIHDHYWRYLSRVMEVDSTKENNKKCNECSVQYICSNGCPLISDEVRENYYCKLKRAVYQPIIDMVLNMDDINA